MVDMDNKVAFTQGAGVVDELFCPAFACGPDITLSQQILLGDDGEIRAEKPVIDIKERHRNRFGRQGADVGIAVDEDGFRRAMFPEDGCQTFTGPAAANGQQRAHPPLGQVFEMLNRRIIDIAAGLVADFGKIVTGAPPGI